MNWRLGVTCATAAVTSLATIACLQDPAGPSGPGIHVNIAPLTLPGAKDVCYGLYVQNGSGDVVAYVPNVCSSQYGNIAGGDISYVIPCDAQQSPTAANATNKVTLVLEGIDLDDTAATSWLDETQYRNPCGWDATSPLATVDGQALPLDTSPTYAGPGANANVNWDGFACQREVQCEENADVAVTFNLTVMRDADQGFFDVAVNFEDIFCSAKVDCAYPNGGGAIDLVTDPTTGERVPSIVWAFACTDGDPQGADPSTATHLYLNDLVLDCGGTQYPIPVSAGPGNIYPAAGTPPAPLVQAMVFEGRELIHNGAVDADKLYWNVALGLKSSFFTAGGPTCTLTTRATASRGPLTNAITPANTNYPLITADVTLNSGAAITCTQHPLDGTGANAGVATAYTGSNANQSGFATASFANEGTPTSAGGISTGHTKYRYIPAGTFTMGGPAGEVGMNANEAPQHEVTLTHDFWLKATEVTQAEWSEVMGSSPSSFASCGPNCPVEQVTWFAAVDYVNELSDAAGFPRCYDATYAFAGVDCLGYRLPTEAEWEYAARAGTTTATYNGDLSTIDCTLNAVSDAIAWYCGNSGNTTHPVALKAANPWGLSDMLGNVFEWVQDWNGAYPASSVTDPVGAATGTTRILRGGSWAYWAKVSRAAYREDGAPPGTVDSSIGFRPARTAP